MSEIYAPERDDEHPRLFQKGVPLHPEHYFWGNVTQYAVKNSPFCCLKVFVHAVRLFTKLIYFAIISVKIRLFFNATQ